MNNNDSLDIPVLVHLFSIRTSALEWRCKGEGGRSGGGEMMIEQESCNISPDPAPAEHRAPSKDEIFLCI